MKQKQQINVLVLILTYNEEVHVADVIADVRQNFPVADILVVDGESTDKTQMLAKKAGAWVIPVSNRLGIAGGMEAGLLFARYKEYDYLIRIDGDGQHEAKDIDILFQPVLNREADMVIGSRFKDKDNNYNASLIRLIANKLFSFLTSLLVGQKIYDTTSGFQVLNRKVVNFLCQLENFEYSEIETLILLKKAGFTILEIPVMMNPRVGSKSSFNFIRAFFYVFMGMVSLFLNIDRKSERRKDLDS